MADVTALREDLRRWAADVVDLGTDLMVDELREAAPLGQTGETRRGVGKMPGAAGPNRFGATLRSTGKGGDFVEAGTAPHTIEPRTAKVLRFMGGSGRISTAAPSSRMATRGGGVVFAKVVHHPGTPPRPWFHPVMDRWEEFLDRAAAQVR